MPKKDKGMILGVGSDIVEIERIQKILERHANRFLNYVFTQPEITYAQKRVTIAPTLANRFAAKEATVKALGTGISQGIHWKDIEIQNAPSGQPIVLLQNKASAVLKTLTPEGKTPRIFCSLSHSDHYALAVVMIEAL
jgi:holo-[acyl-carrier protein] synthase